MATKWPAAGAPASSSSGTPSNILDRPLNKPLAEVNACTFALLFSELVRYAQSRVHTVNDLQIKLAAMGRCVGERVFDSIVMRAYAGAYKRETRLLPMLMFVKSTVWRHLFNKDADKLERSSDDPKTYLLIEKDPVVNTYVSVPKDKSSLNCAAFIGGILEAILNDANFACKVSVHWHNGTTYMSGVNAYPNQILTGRFLLPLFTNPFFTHTCPPTESHPHSAHPGT